MSSVSENAGIKYGNIGKILDLLISNSSEVTTPLKNMFCDFCHIKSPNLLAIFLT